MVTVEFTVAVVAASAADAECHARWHGDLWIDARDGADTHAQPVRSLRDLPRDWHGALPYHADDDADDERPCEAWIAAPEVTP